MMMAACSTETEKKLGGEWKAEEYDSDLEATVSVYLNLEHESADGRLVLAIEDMPFVDVSMTWFADDNEMDVTLDLDKLEVDPDTGLSADEAKRQISLLLGANLKGSAKWRIKELTDSKLILVISGEETEFQRL